MGKGQTDRHTHTHTRTCRLLDQLGPEGRVGEKNKVIQEEGGIKYVHKTDTEKEGGV